MEGVRIPILLFLIPLALSLITIPLTYKFLTPRVTGGQVALKQGTLLQYAGFGAAMTLSFVILFVVAAVITAVVFGPLLKDPSENSPLTVWIAIYNIVRFFLAQLIFFGLTVFFGKFMKNRITVESTFAAWKAAWIPAGLFVLIGVVVGYFLFAGSMDMSIPIR